MCFLSSSPFAFRFWLCVVRLSLPHPHHHVAESDFYNERYRFEKRSGSFIFIFGAKTVYRLSSPLAFGSPSSFPTRIIM
jgi:hypothetical protein